MSRLTLVVARYLPHLGGIEIHVAELAGRVAAAGWEVTVAALDTADGAAPAPDRAAPQDSVRVLRFPGQVPAAGHAVWSPALWRFLRRGAGGADVVHVHNYHAPVVLPALSTARARVVFTPHYLGVATSPAARLEHAAYRRVIGPILRRQQPAVVHVSTTEADEFRRDLGRWVPREVHVVPNGVRVEDLIAAAPRTVQGRLVLAASRLEPYKRVDLALRALAYLPDDIWLAIAGEGPQRAELEALAVRLGLRDRVRMLGRLSWKELACWYRSADVFVSLSTRECFGMAVAEALAAGAGIVASDIPAHREVLTSAAYPPDTTVPVDAAAGQVAAAIERAALRRTEAGTRRTLTWDDMADAVLDVYAGRGR